MKRADEIMSTTPALLSPEQTLAEAAQILSHDPIGAVLIGTEGKVEGGLTVLSALNALGSHQGPDTPLRSLAHVTPLVHARADTRALRETFHRFKTDLVAVVDAAKHPIGLITEAALDAAEGQDEAQAQENEQVEVVAEPVGRGGKPMAEDQQRPRFSDRMRCLFRGDGSTGALIRRSTVLIAGSLLVLAVGGVLVRSLSVNPTALVLPFLAAAAILTLVMRLIWAAYYPRAQRRTNSEKPSR
ncbi:CBS domain-containing protein [Streptomyces sp. NPDC054975]